MLKNKKKIWVPANNLLKAGTVPANNFLKAGTVPANNFLKAGTVPANNHILKLNLLNFFRGKVSMS